MAAFHTRAAEIGLAAAFKERDAPFAEGVPIDVPSKWGADTQSAS
jgi:hypothetical protein